MTKPGHIVVGISGASGVRYGIRLVEVLVRAGWQVHLLVTPSAWRVMQEEEGLDGVGPAAPLEKWLNLPEGGAAQVLQYKIKDIAARPASGTFRARAMIIMPTSMKTLAGIAHGYTDDLLTRCADVFLKERRPLVLVPRETPLNSIHLENMLKLAQAGAHMVPAMPGFYCQPDTLDDIVDFMVAKVLNLLQIDHDIEMEWKGPRNER
ncbi:MAG: UbiX family flavin prenyltransferase [Candidatus Sumerlaeia bacterium]|nr:UbiX family flavin prenyltransferase [Candidatus Sumerlaeia bacterium]